MYFVFFFKQKTAYEMRISDWSSDVLFRSPGGQQGVRLHLRLSIFDRGWRVTFDDRTSQHHQQPWRCPECLQACLDQHGDGDDILCLRAGPCARKQPARRLVSLRADLHPRERHREGGVSRSEEHTSELQSLMRISYAVFCLKKKNHEQPHHNQQN